MAWIAKIVSQMQHEKTWFLAKQCEPRRWGRYGWSTYLGFVWIACYRNPDRYLSVAWRIVHLAPSLLLCRYCSKHFYSYCIKHPLDYEQVIQDPSILFHWICECWYDVHQRMRKCGEVCWVQLWINDRLRTTKDWYMFFRKRFGKPAFVRLWRFEVGLFLTTTLRCLSMPSKWSGIQRYVVSQYISDCYQIACDSNQLIAPQLESLTTHDQWSNMWFEILTHIMFNNAQDANMVWTLSEQSMKIYVPRAQP